MHKIEFELFTEIHNQVKDSKEPLKEIKSFFQEITKREELDSVKGDNEK